MKKSYIKPESVVESVVAEEIIAVSVGVGEPQETGTTDVSGRRGEWGNVWK